MPRTIIDLLKKGVQANKADKFRQGNLICLPSQGSLVVTGDIHGHQRNFERIIAFADLDDNPDRHLVLQEIIHGGQKDSEGHCQSYKLLFEAVRYKLKFPDRIHLIMGNHDTTVISDGKVMKDGIEMNRSMNLALDREFKDESAEIKQAIKQFLLSQPLAVRCDNRIWISHSLPSDRYYDKFDKQIFEKQLQNEDIAKPGSAYLLTWGRKHNQELLDKMAELLDVDIFILGHQTQTQGWTQAAKNLIILICEHGHGCLLPIDLSKHYTMHRLIDLIMPLASIS